jgi:hypothetical protein
LKLTISYFSWIEHLITSLQNKFHIFIMSQYLVMNFTRNYTIYYFLKKLKRRKHSLSVRRRKHSLSVWPNRTGGPTLLSPLFLSSWPKPAQHRPRPKSRASPGPSLPLSLCSPPPRATAMAWPIGAHRRRHGLPWPAPPLTHISSEPYKTTWSNPREHSCG